MSKEKILKCLVQFFFRAAKGTFSAGSPFSSLLLFLRRINNIASISATRATTTIGTAMAALVPGDMPPPDVDLANAAPSLEAEVVEAPVALPVVDPEAAAPLDVFSDNAEVPVCDEEVSELDEEALGDDVDVAAGVAEDIDDWEFWFAWVDVANVVLIELSLDCSEACALLASVVGMFPGFIGSASLMVVNKAAMLEVKISGCKVKGGEGEPGILSEDMSTLSCGTE